MWSGEEWAWWNGSDGRKYIVLWLMSISVVVIVLDVGSDIERIVTAAFVRSDCV